MREEKDEGAVLGRPGDCEIKAGMVVRLASGSPRMVVESTSPGNATVTWWEGGCIHRTSVGPDALEVIIGHRGNLELVPRAETEAEKREAAEAGNDVARGWRWWLWE